MHPGVRRRQEPHGGGVEAANRAVLRNALPLGGEQRSTVSLCEAVHVFSLAHTISARLGSLGCQLNIAIHCRTCEPRKRLVNGILLVYEAHNTLRGS